MGSISTFGRSIRILGLGAVLSLAVVAPAFAADRVDVTGRVISSSLGEVQIERSNGNKYEAHLPEGANVQVGDVIRVVGPEKGDFINVKDGGDWQLITPAASTSLPPAGPAAATTAPATTTTTVRSDSFKEGCDYGDKDCYRRHQEQGR